MHVNNQFGSEKNKLDCNLEIKKAKPGRNLRLQRKESGESLFCEEKERKLKFPPFCIVNESKNEQ